MIIYGYKEKNLGVSLFLYPFNDTNTKFSPGGYTLLNHCFVVQLMIPDFHLVAWALNLIRKSLVISTTFMP